MHLLNGPTEEQMNEIKTELKEDEERLEHNLQLLKSWISFQDHLPKNYDPRILPIFLRGCKHDLERCKRKIEIFFTCKQNVPELFANRDTTSSECLTTSKLMAIVPLPNLNKDGCRVTILKLMTSDSTDYSVEHIARACFMIGDIRLVEEQPIAGDIFIMDGGNNVKAVHVAKTANVILSKALAVAHEGFPQRLKRIHVLNLPDYAEKILALLKGFMKEKMRSRFIVHKNVDELLEFISPEVLPVEYNGTGGNFEKMHLSWQQYLIEKNDWFKQQESVKATGPIPKHLSQSCAFDCNSEGLQGSFRKLAID